LTHLKARRAVLRDKGENLGGCNMSAGDLAFLALVLAGFAAFMGVLGFYWLRSMFTPVGWREPPDRERSARQNRAD
jgi:hypothetical protein